MEDIKESKKVLTDYMLELNADIQRAEDYVNTGADEEMYFALKTVLDRLEQLEKDYGELERKYIWGNLMYDKVLKENKFWKEYKEKLDKLDAKDFIFKHELENYIPKSVIRELIEDYKDQLEEIDRLTFEVDRRIPKEIIRMKIEHLQLLPKKAMQKKEVKYAIDLLKELLGGSNE